MPFTLSDGTTTVDVSTLDRTSGDLQSFVKLHLLNVDVDVLQLFGRTGQYWNIDGQLLSDYTAARNQIRTWFRGQTSVTYVDDEWPLGVKVKVLSYQFVLPRGILGFIRVRLMLQESLT